MVWVVLHSVPAQNVEYLDIEYSGVYEFFLRG